MFSYLAIDIEVIKILLYQLNSSILKFKFLIISYNMSNWLDHVKKTMSMNPGTPLKDVLKMAKKTYKKTASVAKYAVTGKHAKKGRKSRRRKSKKGGMAHDEDGMEHDEMTGGMYHEGMTEGMDHDEMTGGMRHKKGGKKHTYKTGGMSHKKTGGRRHKKTGGRKHKRSKRRTRRTRH